MRKRVELRGRKTLERFAEATPDEIRDRVNGADVQELRAIVRELSFAIHELAKAARRG